MIKIIKVSKQHTTTPPTDSLMVTGRLPTLPTIPIHPRLNKFVHTLLDTSQNEVVHTRKRNENAIVAIASSVAARKQEHF